MLTGVSRGRDSSRFRNVRNKTIFFGLSAKGFKLIDMFCSRNSERTLRESGSLISEFDGKCVQKRYPILYRLLQIIYLHSEKRFIFFQSFINKQQNDISEYVLQPTTYESGTQATI
jgi:hypothetical protein